MWYACLLHSRSFTVHDYVNHSAFETFWGAHFVLGTYHGRCFIYTTEQLKYHAVIDVRSSRGKNARGQHKITSLAVHGDKLLITSNDSRIRMYDLRDMEMICKFKGAQIEQSRIRASFSPDGRHIISGRVR